MNPADLKSPRLRRVLEFLQTHSAPSTKEIEDACCVASARDYVRRLRDHGLHIETIEAGTSPTGARIVRYALRREVGAQRDLFERGTTDASV